MNRTLTWLIGLVLALVAFGHLAWVFHQEAEDPPAYLLPEGATLVPDSPVVAECLPKDLHFYRFQARVGDYIELSLNQLGQDLTITVTSPSNETVMFRDGMQGRFGVELVCFFAEETGEYLLELASPAGHQGSYELTLTRLNEPQTKDFYKAYAYESEQFAANESLSIDTILKSWEMARDCWLEADMQDQAAYVWLTEEANAVFKHDWNHRINCLHKALELLEEDRLNPIRGMIHEMLGACYTRQGYLSKGIHHFEQALDIRAAKDSDRLNSLRNMAEAQSRIGDLKQAERFLDEAKQVLRAIDAPEEWPWVYRLEGNILREKGDPKQAKLSYERALAHLSPRPDLEKVAALHARIGRVARDLGEHSQAIQAFETAIDQLGKITPTGIDPYRLQVNALGIEIAETHLASGNLSTATKMLRDLTPTFEGHDLSMAHIEYLNARAAYLLGEPDKARLFLNRSLSLTQKIRSQTARGQRAYFTASRFPRIQLLSDILSQNDDEETVKATFNSIERSRARYLIDLIHERGIHYASDRKAPSVSDVEQKISTPPPIGLETIQKELLNEDTLMLYFSMGEEKVWLWEIGRDRFKHHFIGRRETLEQEILDLYRELAEKPDTDPSRADRIEAACRKLGNLILGKLGDFKGKRLVIAPTGALRYLPFSTLYTEREPDDPLFVKHQLVYIPSASVLFTLQQRGSEARGKNGGVVAFGDPDLPLQTDLPNLPYARAEIESIKGLFPDPPLDFLGPDATKENVRTHAPDAWILHFATHAQSDQRFGERSQLFLSGDSESSISLKALELKELQINAELVVLSACKTALGEELPGEGLLGLPHAFLEAGAASVLASLWSQDDEAAKILMVHFYEHLVQHGDIAAALGYAQRKLYGDPRYKSPFYWAGWQLQGRRQLNLKK